MSVNESTRQIIVTQTLDRLAAIKERDIRKATFDKLKMLLLTIDDIEGINQNVG
jgi:hypothetical protein